MQSKSLACLSCLLPNWVPSTGSGLKEVTQNPLLGKDFGPRPGPSRVWVWAGSGSRWVVRKPNTDTTKRSTTQRKRIALINEHISLHSLCSKLVYIWDQKLFSYFQLPVTIYRRR